MQGSEGGEQPSLPGIGGKVKFVASNMDSICTTYYKSLLLDKYGREESGNCRWLL